MINCRRALVCSCYPPDYDRDSVSQRVLDLIGLLRADGWIVVFVGSRGIGEPRHSRNLRQLGVAVFDGTKVRIEELAAAMRFDLALLEFWADAEMYLPALRRVSPHTRLIVDATQPRFGELQDRHVTGALSTNLGSDLIRRFNIYAASDAVLTASQEEADWLNDLIPDGTLAQALPDMGNIAGPPVPLAKRRGILFMGSFHQPSNIGAVKFLCKQIVPCLNPAVLAKHPIFVIGEELDETVRQLAAGLPQVQMVGAVPSMSPYIERTRIMVVPLRYGPGNKISLIRAVMAGTPIVSTSVGVEGLNLRNRKDVLIADEPEAFAEAITRILEDDSLWRRLSEHGCVSLLPTHGREAVQARLREINNSVLTAKPKQTYPEICSAQGTVPERQQYNEVVMEDNSGTIYHLAASEPRLALSRPEDPMLSDRAETPSDVRLIAFYSPHFHATAENDAWWGKGFTDWVPVREAVPLFPGHYQRHAPAELGFYDSLSADTRQAQASLARLYGIHGFCYYHYWFHGKRLLGRPFEEVRGTGKPDFPFCLCWANKPWVRRWNDHGQEILQAQTYSVPDDLAHIRWLLPALADRRAIQIEGKPVFLVYHGLDLPNPARTLDTWRSEVHRAGLPGIYLICVETDRDAGCDATKLGFDARVLFQPQFAMLFNSGAQIPITVRAFDYKRAWPVLANASPVSYRRYDTVFPNWDNSARIGEKTMVVHNSSPAEYEKWLRQAVANARSRSAEHRIVFINAWNQWGEGCHLEPDTRFGRAYLEATHRALVPLSSNNDTTATATDSALQPLPSHPNGGRPSDVSLAVGPQEHLRANSVSSALPAAYQTMLATARGERGSEYVGLAETNCSPSRAEVRLIAFYLPQFHAIAENDQWWGKGFTEWTNVSKATPQFIGHYQPCLPGELGFYDLRVPEVQRRQVELARNYGIFGFCFHYYWFAGKHLLDRPLMQFMADPAIDFPFCLCWANENWTRRWDGREDEILIGQNHSQEMDSAFIRDIDPILRHKNYIRIHGRPVLIIYRVRLLSDPAATAARWRSDCRTAGLENPYLIAAEVFENIDPRTIGFDAAVEFPPNTVGPRTEISKELSLLNPDYSGQIYRYTDLVRLAMDRPPAPYPFFRTVCPQWDNEPRRPGRGATYAFSDPGTYGRWLKEACNFALKDPDPEKRVVFINAWNEWGEGAYLEPDRRYGYAYLQATADVMASIPARTNNLSQDWTILFVSHDACRAGAQLVLLNTISWLKKYTTVRPKVLCLDSGEWLPRFQELADTIVWNELQENASSPVAKDLVKQLLNFCGGKPSLIYGNSVASGRAYAVLSQLDAPILTHFHELEMSIKRYAGDWIVDVLKHSAHYIACSDAVSDNLARNHGVVLQKISTVYSSIRTDPDFSPLTGNSRTALRQRLGLMADKQLIVGCGVGMPFRKGADLFIQAARHLCVNGKNGFHFYWIGTFDKDHQDPKYGLWTDHLKTLEASVARHITFLGLVDDPTPYFQAADIFLLPSREDPFPLAALEAAACGLPIICFDNAGGMPSFVSEDAGYVVPFGNVKAMARRITNLMEDQDKRCQLGLQARKKLLSRFTIDFTAPHILSACRSVVRKRPTVSVIVPNYNHGRFLRERLSSIFNQTYRDFEVILLDDASSDNSLEIFEEYRDYADVQIVRNKRNSGSTFKQWLKGIELARADILWIAESDDRSEPDFLETLLPSFRDPRVKLAYANSHVIDENGTVVGEYTNTRYLASLSPTKWAESYQVSAEQEINDGLGIKNTILSASSVVFRRFALSPQARKRMADMRFAGDWYFFIHAIARGELYYSSRKLNHHRRHAESVVGKLLRQNRVGPFFREFYEVQSVIFKRYPLFDGFHRKWEQYLRDQWQEFFPDRPFEDLKEYYPVNRLSGQIMASVSSNDRSGIATESKPFARYHRSATARPAKTA